MLAGVGGTLALNGFLAAGRRFPGYDDAGAGGLLEL